MCLRIIYLFALAIYSSQLDCRKKIVQTWFHKLADKNQVFIDFNFFEILKKKLLLISVSLIKLPHKLIIDPT